MIQRSDTMATISAYDSSSLGVLFSSLQTNQTKRNGFSAGFGTDLLGINLVDYATIQSGSYHKLLDAYYAKGETSDEIGDMLSTNTSKDDAKTLAQIEDAAEGLLGSADKLLETGKNSVFEKVTKTDESGTTKTEYDTDAIYKAVSAFVEDYNQLLKEAEDSHTTSISRAASAMVNYSKVNEKLLAKVGITIGKGNRLEIDEEAFKKADMETVKDLFHERGSFGYQIKIQASLTQTYAKTEAARANTYGKNGGYTYNYNTGEIYNSVV